MSRNQFEPVWAETFESYPARKLELLSPQNLGVWPSLKKFIDLLQPILSINGYLRVSFINVTIVKLVDKEILNQKNLKEGQNKFLFWLWVWLHRGWAETSLNQFEQKRKKLPCTETGIAQPPKQEQRSPMWHMKDKRHNHFVKASFV